jgi:hypothetical protein
MRNAKASWNPLRPLIANKRSGLQDFNKRRTVTGKRGSWRVSATRQLIATLKATAGSAVCRWTKTRRVGTVGQIRMISRLAFTGSCRITDHPGTIRSSCTQPGVRKQTNASIEALRSQRTIDTDLSLMPRARRKDRTIRL